MESSLPFIRPAPGSTHTIVLEQNQIQDRLDRVLAQLLSAFSRSYIQKLIAQDAVKINDMVVRKAGHAVKGGDQITITFPIITINPSDKIMPPELEPTLVFEHKNFLIIDKPAGLAVHKPHTHAIDYTLVDWLLTTFHDLAQVGVEDRPGIVHRLDKNTSGLMIIARNNYAHALFCDLFKQRAISKTYRAFVVGHAPTSGSIDLPIGRDPFVPTKMGFRAGRAALTHYKLLTTYNNVSFIELYPITGRTHQIRVHCAAIGHPLIGDVVYGTASPLLSRHALHAYRLAFTIDGQAYEFTREMPSDLRLMQENLQQPTRAA
jgi:23S rRNA pseudouridine1911/1915/1917 synthase